jgi:Flp pilus assembly protein TadD
VAPLRRALQVAPDSSAVHYELGLALADAGRPDEALDRFRAALRLQPESPEIQRRIELHGGRP